MTTSTCKTCGEEKPRSEFYKHPSGTGRRIHCKKCLSAKKRMRYQNEPVFREKAKRHQREWRKRHPMVQGLRRHGLTMEDYEQLLAAQDGGCGACGRTEPGGGNQRFHVDHDHDCCSGDYSCGRCIRGLLCHWCNTALGLIDEEPEKLLVYLAVGKALAYARYIERPVVQMG